MICLVAALFVLQDAPSDDTARKIDALCAQLSDDDPERREAATEELMTLGRPALRAVLRLRSSDDAEVRGRAEALVRELKKPFEAAALKLEIKLLAGPVAHGEPVAFEARLVNIEEFEVQVSRRGKRRPSFDSRATTAFGGLEYLIAEENEDFEIVQVTVRPGMSLDVSAETSVQVLSKYQAYAMRHGVDATSAPLTARLAAGAHVVLARWRAPRERPPMTFSSKLD